MAIVESCSYATAAFDIPEVGGHGIDYVDVGSVKTKGRGEARHFCQSHKRSSRRRPLPCGLQGAQGVNQGAEVDIVFDPRQRCALGLSRLLHWTDG